MVMRFKGRPASPSEYERSSRGVLLGILIVGQFSSCAEKGIAADWARVGSEFLVNSYTSSFQAQSQVSVAADGKFVVAWESNVQDGSGSGVAVRGFDTYGVAAGPDRIINETTDGEQARPAIATLANAGVVVAWENVTSGALPPDVRIRVLSDALVPVGSEILVGEPGVRNDYGPSLTASADGGFLLLWERYNPLTESDVLARFYDANGVPRTPEFQINEYTTGLQRLGTAAPLPSGDFIVVWGSDGQDGSRFGVLGRRISAQGDLLGTEFPINTYTPGPQYPRRVRTNTVGDFVVVWEGGGDSDEDDDGIFARRFNKDGVALTPQILVNTFTSSSQLNPDLAIASNNGEFVVTWVSYDGYFTDDGERDLNIRAQVFDADGARVGAEFRVNSETLDFQGFPSIDGTPDGRFVVTWDSDYHDGSSTGVFAQRLVLNPICGDANGDRNTSATDALLVLGAAVGIVSCAPCMCDSNDSGLITATDALLALQSAVGQTVILSCPVCS